jgi:uncharacterized membrane protein
MVAGRNPGMKSKAAIGSHPIHPIIVPIPIGAFFLALIGDVLFTANPEDPFWYQFSHACIGVGVVFALIAAIFGAIDYFEVKMSAAAFRVATWHALLNLTVVGLYGTSLFLRRNEAAVEEGPWTLAASLSTLGFLILGVSGWLGGKLAYEHRVGVVENPEVTGADLRRAAS